MHSLHNVQKVNPSGNGHVCYVLCVSVQASVQAFCKLQEKNMHRVGPQYVCMYLFQIENSWKYFDIIFCVCYCYYILPQIQRLYFPAFDNSSVEEIWVCAGWALQ
jgi:hypothetical protein